MLISVYLDVHPFIWDENTNAIGSSLHPLAIVQYGYRVTLWERNLNETAVEIVTAAMFNPDSCAHQPISTAASDAHLVARKTD